DAGRFRLPLALAAHRLLGTIGALMADRCDVRLLVDTPGVVRGIAASELLSALHAAVVPDAALVLAPGLAGMPFADDLRSWRCPLYVRRPDPGARPLPKGARARRRSALWNAYLRTAVPRSIPGDLPVTGAPPPANAHEAWQGRQAALIAEDGSTVAFGELALSGTGGTQLRVPAGESVTAEGRALLVRDALRSSSGRLETASPARDAVRFSAPPDVLPAAAAAEGPRPIVRIGSLAAALPNGLLGDPLLHVRLGQHRRSLLFDLGEGSRLPARIAHQVSDIFLTHAHFDHIAGFLWFLRARLSSPRTCRIYGPPGIALHIQSLINGILWDRIGDRAPGFRIVEFHEGEGVARSYDLACGVQTPLLLGEESSDGVLRAERDLSIQAITLDHGTPVLAYALTQTRPISIDAARLRDLGLPAGPWVGALKAALQAGRPEQEIPLPDGARPNAAEMAQRLVMPPPPGPLKLVYATDFADTPQNRSRLVALARKAHTLFCEAPFAADHAAQARLTGHLTARACGEIARAADVRQLVAFHFSRRYRSNLDPIYRDIAWVFPGGASPPAGSEG
ncbi:MAG: MBL fold metallo-hydrolase, partial [Chromatiales bacterium]